MVELRATYGYLGGERSTAAIESLKVVAFDISEWKLRLARNFRRQSEGPLGIGSGARLLRCFLAMTS